VPSVHADEGPPINGAETGPEQTHDSCFTLSCSSTIGFFHHDITNTRDVFHHFNVRLVCRQHTSKSLRFASLYRAIHVEENDFFVADYYWGCKNGPGKCLRLTVT
jgi:hypothetical protein